MRQAGDIATMTSWYRVNIKLGKSLKFILRFRLRQGEVREGVVDQNTNERDQSVNCVIMLITFTVKSQATLLSAEVVINRSEQSAVLVPTFHTLPAVS